MTDWQPIETAPKDGTAFQADIPGHGQDNVIFWLDDLVDDDGNECGGQYRFFEGGGFCRPYSRHSPMLNRGYLVN